MNPMKQMEHMAGLQQMKVQARQFAATMALELMKAPGYNGVAGQRKKEGEAFGEPVWVHDPGKTDHITLLAMAGDIESYILGNMENELTEALKAAETKFNAPKIVRP